MVTRTDKIQSNDMTKKLHVLNSTELIQSLAGGRVKDVRLVLSEPCESLSNSL